MRFPPLAVGIESHLLEQNPIWLNRILLMTPKEETHFPIRGDWTLL